MEIQEFEDHLREIADHDDFIESCDLIVMIPKENRIAYANAVAYGYKMKDVFSSLSRGIELSKRLNITLVEVFNLIPHFIGLNKILKGNESISDPIADVIDVIDQSKSYQELNFLREHLEFRIMVYLNDLAKPSTPAMNEEWRKTCPACGHPNHIYNLNCKMCGWFPEN